MRWPHVALALAAIAGGLVSGCAAVPPVEAPSAAAPLSTPAPQLAAARPPAPLIESPPIEPAPAPSEPLRTAEPLPPPAPAPAPAPAPSPPTPVVTSPPPAPAVAAPQTIVVASEPTAEEKEFTALLADLQRYSGLGGDELRREQAAIMQALTRSRSDALRVRLAVLHTLTRTSVQDDQRALALFETVTKGNPASPAVKQLATVLSVQVAERIRAVRDEQARSEAALQKLEALRAMERSLLRDRVRSGGGGGGAGSGGGN